jgi:hypothetical protein
VKRILHGFHVVSSGVSSHRLARKNDAYSSEHYFLPPPNAKTSHLLLTTGDRISPKDASRR